MFHLDAKVGITSSMKVVSPLLRAVFTITLLLISSISAAQEPQPLADNHDQPKEGKLAQVTAKQIIHRRHFALGLSAMNEVGLMAAQIRVRWNYVGAEAAVGMSPVMAIAVGECYQLFLDVSLHTTASLLVFFNNDQKDFSNGLRLGGIYDTKLGWGAIIGWQAEQIIKPWLALQFGIGLQVYPDGASWANGKLHKACSDKYTDISPFLSYVQPYFGFGLLFYLF